MREFLLNLFLDIPKSVNTNTGNHFYSSLLKKLYLATAKIMIHNIELAALFFFFIFKHQIFIFILISI